MRGVGASNNLILISKDNITLYGCWEGGVKMYEEQEQEERMKLYKHRLLQRACTIVHATLWYRYWIANASGSCFM